MEFLKDYGICARCGTASLMSDLKRDEGFDWCINHDLCIVRRQEIGERYRLWKEEKETI